MRVKIIREHGPLRRETWTFSVGVPFGLHEIQVRLNEYADESKKSRRHKAWTADAAWRTYSRRDVPNWIDHPPVPEDVRTEALQIIMSSFRFILPEPGQ